MRVNAPWGDCVDSTHIPSEREDGFSVLSALLPSGRGDLFGDIDLDSLEHLARLVVLEYRD